MKDSFEVPQNSRTIQQVVTDRIRGAILDGTFKPNERLNQAELAERLNVSRIPTREALRTLEGESLVKFYPHRGAVVSAMSPEEIEEVYEMRIWLEISAAQRAVKRIDERQLQKVRVLEGQTAKATEPELWLSLNSRFHEAIYEASGWIRLLSVIGMLRNLTTPYMQMYVSHQFNRDRANCEHAEILEALEVRDTIGLKAVLRRHLGDACQGILAYLKKIEQDSTLSAARAAVNKSGLIRLRGQA